MNQANMANYESSDRRLDSPPANLSKTTASQELEHYQLFQLVKLKWHAQNKNVTISMQNQSSSILLPDRPVVTAFVTFPGIERISKFHRRHVLATLFLNSPAGVSRTVSSSSSSLRYNNLPGTSPISISKLCHESLLQTVLCSASSSNNGIRSDCCSRTASSQ
jgi:hypothetical protein